MKKVGEVVLILNERIALLKATEAVIIGSEVSAMVEIPLADEQRKKVGVESLKLAKGKLKVLQMQAENLYLISTINKAGMTSTEENTTLAKSLTLYNQIFKKKEEAKKTEDGQSTQSAPQAQAQPAAAASGEGDKAEYSANLNKKESMNVDFSLPVKVGDSIFF